ncbi:ubiquitin ligase [Tritrichomonas foetus]|uniref:HECT-type E3 ubiquitin transferase n=1 Tax=Tritrichomonas foetus TaxID=1144522 RepID=A0A1J4KSQ1_9EUKA|nr:ubiquitin ligase [Tritrichomonas foetus]|eukprot:OHT12501.1 ubiquitin ligase [Tritrichomonas foetus]
MDFRDAYFTQFTIGCGHPACTHDECFSSQTFKYLNLPEEEIENLADSFAETSEHLCPNMSPIITNPEILENIIYFSDFANSIINNDESVDFSIFENILESRDAFSLLFMGPSDFKYSDFSIDEDFFIDFLTNALNHEDKFHKFNKAFLELAKSIFTNPNPTTPHNLRAALLLLGFSLLFDQVDLCVLHTRFIDFLYLTHPKELLNFYHSMIQFPKFTEKVLVAAQIAVNSLVTHRLLKSHYVYYFANHVQNMYSSNYKFNAKIHYRKFQNELLSSALDPVFEVELGSRGSSILEFPSILTLSFKKDFKNISINTIHRMNSFFGMLSTFDVKIHRNDILNDTIKALSNKTEIELRKPLNVSFYGEQGEDKGGVSRELFHLVTSELFSPDFGMFELINNSFYWFKQKCFEIANFGIVGLLTSLAFHNSIMLPIRFPVVLYKKLMNIALSMNDLAEIKPEVAQSLQSLLELKNNGDDISSLDLRFEVTIDNFGRAENIPLIENGGDIIVTNENVQQYVDSMIHWELEKSVERQFNAFRDGFWKIRANKIIIMFEPEELDIMISGQTVYNWEELKQSSTYSSGYNGNSETIGMFWKVFDELTENQKIDFLMFATGTKRVPVNGLKEIQLEFQRTTDTRMLPVAHTCAEIIQLPDYKDIELLRKNLLICLEYNEGFGVI